MSQSFTRGVLDIYSLIKSNLLVFDETAFPEVLLALLFLLGLVVGDIGGVAPLVVGVVTLHNIIVLSLLHHLHLVNTFLASSSYSSEASISIFSLARVTPCYSIIMIIFMMSMMVIMLISISIEGECTNQRFSIPSWGCCRVSKLTSS